MKKVIVHTAKKAIRNYNKKMLGFNDIQNRIAVPQPQIPQVPQMTLDDFLRMHGMPATFAIKANIAKKMGIMYHGSTDQDNAILMALQGQKENNMQNNQAQMEGQKADKEHGLKEREMSLKEKQAQQGEQNKMPNADDIADSIMKKFNTK